MYAKVNFAGFIFLFNMQILADISEICIYCYNYALVRGDELDVYTDIFKVNESHCIYASHEFCVVFLLQIII